MYAFLAGFHAPKKHRFWGCTPATGFSSPPLFLAPIFGPWGGSSPFVTPVSGYAYVRVST